MAEGTRWKELQDAQKQLDQKLQGESTKVQEQFSGVNEKLDNLTNLLATLQLQLLNKEKGKGVCEDESILGEPPPLYTVEGQHSQFTPPNTGRIVTERQLTQQVNHSLPKVDFPSFDGSSPRKWILSCNGYFQMYPNLSHARKITMATMNFEGRASLWYQNFASKCANLTWEQFIDLISNKFEEIKEENVIEEFTKLRCGTNYEEYVDKFEELKACMELFDNGGFSEVYYKSCFIGGLSVELKSAIRMFKPNTLQDAIAIGREQIITMEAWAKKVRGSAKPQSYTNPTPVSSYSPDIAGGNLSRGVLAPKAQVKMLTKAEMAARREQGLCYNCDEKYSPGHDCKNINYFMTMTSEEELAYIHAHGEGGAEQVNEELTMEETVLSLNALHGGNATNTMRFTGWFGQQQLDILIDTGSTLSFIKESTAKKLGCGTENTNPLLIRVASGHKLVSTLRTKGFRWDIQGHNFNHPLRLLQNDGCDIIVGCDWMEACSPIEFDFKKKIVTIRVGRKKTRLHARLPDASCQINSHHSLYTLTHSPAKRRIEGIFLLQHYRQNSVELRRTLKLASCYFSPYEIIERVGQVAYHLKLPEGSRIYPVFYVSLLKKQGTEGTNPLKELPATTDEGVFSISPTAVLETRTITRRTGTVFQLLVRWEGESSSLFSWEDHKYIMAKFPNFDPWGQGSQIGGSTVVNKGSPEELRGFGEGGRRCVKMPSLGIGGFGKEELELTENVLRVE